MLWHRLHRLIERWAIGGARCMEFRLAQKIFSPRKASPRDGARQGMQIRCSITTRPLFRACTKQARCCWRNSRWWNLQAAAITTWRTRALADQGILLSIRICGRADQARVRVARRRWVAWASAWAARRAAALFVLPHLTERRGCVLRTGA